MAGRNVEFLYTLRTRNVSSTVMRGEQFSATYGRTAGRDRRVRYMPLVLSTARESVLFFTKGAAARATPRQLAALKRRGNILCFDIVDEVPPPTTDEFADVIVAMSRVGLEDLRTTRPEKRSEVIDHPVDPRIEAMGLAAPNELRIAYFGEIYNTVITDEIARRVEFTEVGAGKRSTDWLDRLKGTAAHYAVRQRFKIDHIKPFIKGFTAAHCRANVVIQESNPEAIVWLGADYPYLVRGEVTETSILSTLQLVQDSFGTDVWRDALARMEPLRHASAGATVAGQFEELVKSFD